MNKENRWVILANLIPWWQFEASYAHTMKRSSRGQKALSVRMALGALYIQEKKGLSDRQTVEEITENPYLQYFIGLPEFREETPFDPSMMTHFRKRLGADIINQLNEAIVMEELKDQNQNQDNDTDDHDEPPSGNTSSEDATEQSDNQHDYFS